MRVLEILKFNIKNCFAYYKERRRLRKCKKAGDRLGIILDQMEASERLNKDGASWSNQPDHIVRKRLLLSSYLKSLAMEGEENLGPFANDEACLVHWNALKAQGTTLIFVNSKDPGNRAMAWTVEIQAPWLPLNVDTYKLTSCTILGVLKRARELMEKRLKEIQIETP